MHLAVLCTAGTAQMGQRLSELASFYGISSRLVEVSGPKSMDELNHELGPKVRAIILTAATLKPLSAAFRSGAGVAESLKRPGREVMVVGLEASPEQSETVKWLTGGAVRAITSIKAATQCSFPIQGAAYTRQLAGAVFDRKSAANDCCFELDESGAPPVTRLMEVGGKPTFVCAGEAGREMFLWAGTSIPALEDKAPGEGLASLYDQILPALVFIRWAFKQSAYENPFPTAHVIIDDPLLRPRYGFLDYSRLVRSLEGMKYGLSIAFIPWNFRRTRRQTAELFAAHASHLSLCVHGCDHTGSEFGGGDQLRLEQKASLALERMLRHQELTGLPFERVMVFPQGLFSKPAISALRRNGYLAAVNTTKVPVDAPEPELTVSDELMPAVNRYSGLPILHRRYPRDLAQCAVDLFLGKPAYVVEHHEVFKQGCEPIENCVRTLNRMDSRLSWPKLSAGIGKLHLRRQLSEGELDVRFFTNTFRFDNPSERTVTCRFSKPEADSSVIKRIHLDGRDVEFERSDRFISFEALLRPGEGLRIEIEDREKVPVPRYNPGASYALKTRARRYLSEFRDNCLARHPAFLKPAKLMVGLLRGSPQTPRQPTQGVRAVRSS